MARVRGSPPESDAWKKNRVIDDSAEACSCTTKKDGKAPRKLLHFQTNIYPSMRFICFLLFCCRCLIEPKWRQLFAGRRFSFFCFLFFFSFRSVCLTPPPVRPPPLLRCQHIFLSLLPAASLLSCCSPALATSGTRLWLRVRPSVCLASAASVPCNRRCSAAVRPLPFISLRHHHRAHHFAARLCSLPLCAPPLQTAAPLPLFPSAMQLSQYLPAALKECKCIDFDSETLQQALVLVIAAPLIWNIVARTIRSEPCTNRRAARSAEREQRARRG